MAKPRRRPRSGPIVIRRLTAADFDGYAALMREADVLHHRALPHMIRAPTQSRPRISEFEAMVRDSDQRLFGAERDGALSGFVHALHTQSPGGRAHKPFRFVSVELISVARKARRTGIGRALMTEVVRWARKRKVRMVHLGVYEFNRGAIAFYRRLGFKIIVRYMDFALR